jgi:acetyltransferase-like isoleucine patch superfamily enzyme
MFRRLLARLLNRTKGEAAYPIALQVDERLAFQILTAVIPRAVRGLALKPRLGNCKGIPLIGKGVRISNPQLISCGRAFVVEDFAEIQGLSREGISFGDNVTIGRGAQIRPSGYYGRDVGVGLTVGNDSNIGPQAYIGASGGIVVGHQVLFGPGAIILSEEHVIDDPHRAIKSQGVRHARTIIEDNVWLGARVTVLGGTGSVIAAGAVVRSDVPPYSVAAGVPARLIRDRNRQ